MLKLGMKKSLFFIIAAALLYEDIKKFCVDIFRGTPEIEGIFLLGPKTDFVKSRLVEYFNTPPSIYTYTLYGDGKIPVSCHKININSNNIYLSFLRHSDYEIPPCVLTNQSIFLSITHAVTTPLYIQALGYKSMHFFIFGNYFNTSKYILDNDIQALPYGSSITITAPTTYQEGLFAINEEVTLKSFIPYTSNHYIKYVYYLVINPENNIFIINSPSGVCIFNSEITHLTRYSDETILDWQRSQIISFYHFIENITFNVFDIKFRAFKKLITDYLHERSNQILQQQKLNLARYKELLLFISIAKNDLSTIQLLLESAVNIESKLLNGATPIYVASYLSKIPIMQLLLNLGASVEISGYNKMTPLLLASMKGFTKAVEILLEGGANPNAKDANHYTPLIMASLKCYSKIINLLVAHGADVNYVNNMGEYPLNIAAHTCSIDIVQHLLASGAKFIKNAKNPIISAINAEKFDIVKLLLSYIEDYEEAQYLSSKNLSPSINFIHTLVYYVLKHNYNVLEAIDSIDRIEAQTLSKAEEFDVQQVKECLFDLDYDKSYLNLLDLCGVVRQADACVGIR